MDDSYQSADKSGRQPTPEFDHRERIKHSISKAEKYQHRKAKKHMAEMALIHRALPLLSGVEHFLDAPCGVGRATILLARSGYQVTAIDLGEGALELAKQAVQNAGLQATIEKQDLVSLGYADRQFDATLCFRLIHHLPTSEHRKEIIRELCRVTDRYVLISYLSPWSYTSTMRLLKKKLGKASIQNVTTLAELEAHFRNYGFRQIKDLAQARLIHSLHLAVFERER